MPTGKHVNANFFKTWTSDMAYTLGFFCADGTITQNKNGSKYFVLQIKDRNHLYAMRRILNSNHKIAKRTHRKDFSIFYRLQIGNSKFVGCLEDLIQSKEKTYRMTLPIIPTQLFRDFVRGYFDGDGNVWSGLIHKQRNNPSLTLQSGFTSCSDGFLEELRENLSKNGLSGSLYPRKGKNVFRLQYSTRSSILLYRIMYDNLSESNLFLKRKKKVFDAYLKLRT